MYFLLWCKQARDWAVEQLADLFRTTDECQDFNITKSQGQNLGDIHLMHTSPQGLPPSSWIFVPHMVNKPLTNAAADKTQFANTAPRTISFMPAVTGTSGRLHFQLRARFVPA